MKTLIITRHAKSDWTNPLQKDFDRTLNERGTNDAPMMGKRLLQRKIVPDIIISSTAVRAAQTASAIANSLQYNHEKIKWLNRLYHASADTISEVISETDDNLSSLLIVCHNPGITHFVNSVCGFVTMNVPTCGMTAFQIDTDQWHTFLYSKSRLLFFDFPKNSNPIL